MIGKHPIKSCPLSILAVVFLFGCAGSGERYPSLATRDVERVQGMFEPVDPALLEPTAAPADQESRLATLTQQADAVHARFMAAVPGTRSLISAVDASGPESNAWASAQIALADLESLRSQAAIALGDLDLLHAEASTDFMERKAIADARQQVISRIQTEDEILAELRAEADR